MEPQAPPTTPALVSAPGAPLRVLDAASGDAVANAEVYFVQLTQLEGIPAGTTDARGVACVPRELLRRDALVVVAAGYVEYREAATLREIDTNTHIVEIQPYFSASVRVLRIWAW